MKSFIVEDGIDGHDIIKQSLMGDTIGSNSVQEISSSSSSVVVNGVRDIASVVGLSNIPFASFSAKAGLVLDVVTVLGDDGSLTRLGASNNVVSSRNSVSFLEVIDKAIIIIKGFEALSDNISGGEFSSEDLSNTGNNVGERCNLSSFFSGEDILINGERESSLFNTSDDSEITS